MVIEWTSILIIIALLTVALFIIKILEKTININAEIKRKLFHMSMGLSMLTLPYMFKSNLSLVVLATIALLILFVLKKTKLKDGLGSVLYSVNRESVGEVFFVLAVFLIFNLSKGNKILYSIPILILTFADSAAALIGKNYGKKNIAQQNEDAKSIEGSFMFFIVAFMATLVPLLLFTAVGREETLIISTIIGFNVALIEMISHTGNDNLLIPLTSYAFLALLINSNVLTLRYHLLALGIIFVLVSIVNRVKSWSKLALVEIAVIGYLTVILYGMYAIIPPLMLLLTSLRFPKLRECEKNNVYDSRIIETNIIIGIVICVLATITGYKEELFMTYVTCYAMHLTVNTFVRFKYFLNFSEGDSFVFAVAKGLGFVFVPGVIVQKLVFNTVLPMQTLLAMIFMIIASGLCIWVKKLKVTKEETTIKNGYMHMKIVGVLTIILMALQYFLLNGSIRILI